MKIKNRALICLLTLSFLLNLSCGSKNVLEAGEIKSDMSAKNIIKNHYDNALDFGTMSGRIRIDYTDGESTQGVTVSLRMQKDEAIWISAPLSVVKAIITPTRVSFYNKLDNTYFDGDFSYLNKLLGTELNYQMVQNLLLGQAILDLHDQQYYAASVANKYQLKPEDQAALFKTLFLLEPSNFKMALQQISQPRKGRLLSIDYKNYQTVDGKVIPNEIQINTMDKEHKNQIEIEYNNIEFNKHVSFPYNIPSGFKQIEIE
ncbi:DUF4292 domain-containing protein [Galbibacter pacificus]|uniref:DUF4292 domain-containing protein n=1 Tax=Galbibacter pacificus TaxID=2996052 RepID=A0ABT6FU67_9FLAO|nr:DUF4292 domain-containing protein [Galbibacter pacificus]MDG3583319.1 DUF4292 domain-containing protein [Galbibacter pacificus]MDG3586800.1 DUF4292 domain-containing protein [Galbibacter pacificus]